MTFWAKSSKFKDLLVPDFATLWKEFQGVKFAMENLNYKKIMDDPEDFEAQILGVLSPKSLSSQVLRVPGTFHPLLRTKVKVEKCMRAQERSPLL